MNKVSISKAIKMARISRSHFYNKYVNTGAISIINEDNKKLIDVSELIRVFGQIHPEQTDLNIAKYTQNEQSSIVLLEQQIFELKKRESEAREREEWLKAQIDELRSQANRLLEDKTPKKRRKVFGIF